MPPHPYQYTKSLVVSISPTLPVCRAPSPVASTALPVCKTPSPVPSTSTAVPVCRTPSPVPSTSTAVPVCRTPSPVPLTPAIPYGDSKSQKILQHIRTTSSTLTPKKKFLYKEVLRCKRALNYFRKQAKAKKKLLDDSALDPLINSIKRLNSKMSDSALIFIQSQLKSFHKKTRWTIKEKALFLALYKKSPKTYRFLQNILVLPSRSTLMRSLSHINIKAGINSKIIEHLGIISKTMQPLNQNVVLMFDEMKLQPHLELNKCAISGLVEYSKGKENKIADHVLVFMLRIINKKWQQPLAYFFVQTSVPAVILKNLIIEIIQTVHLNTNFKVLATISDQGTTNVRAIRELSNSDVYRYKIDEHEIIHIFDPPHLLKGIRNAFLTKNIIYDGNLAKFSHIEELYKIDAVTPDGKICPNLTKDHINPKGRKKMKVRLAAQLFSHSVYAGLSFAANCGVLENSNTAKFVFFMDRLFNSVNSVLKSNKPLNGPVNNKSPHLLFWTDARKILHNLIFIDRFTGKRVAASPSVKNFRVTLENIELLWKKMHKLGFKYLATRSLNQDPLENFFGYIRGLCGQNTNPNTIQFCSAFKTAVINNVIIHSSSGNCENDNTKVLFSLEILMQQTSEVHGTPLSSSANVQGSTSTKEFLPQHAVRPVQPYLLEMSHSIYTDVSKLSIHFRFQTSAYIAGFIANKCLKNNYCHSCANFMVTDTQASEDYTLIVLKEYNKQLLKYPNEAFVNIINLLKKQIMQLFPTAVTSKNVILRIVSETTVSIPDFCNQHAIKDYIKYTITYIMVKHILCLINRKVQNKDTRPNQMIDDYVKLFGPK